MKKTAINVTDCLAFLQFVILQIRHAKQGKETLAYVQGISDRTIHLVEGG